MQLLVIQGLLGFAPILTVANFFEQLTVDRFGLSAATFGFLTMTASIGAIIGAGALAVTSDVQKKGRWLLSVLVAYGVAYLLLGGGPGLVTVVAMFGGAAGTGTVARLFTLTLLQGNVRGKTWGACSLSQTSHLESEAWQAQE